MIGAVGQFAGHAGATHRGFALHHFAGLAGCGTGRGGQHNLFYNGLGLLGMLLQVLVHGGGSGLRYGRCSLRVTQFGLGLAFELRLGHLYGNNGGKALAEVFRAKVALELGQEVILFGIVLQGTGQAHLEALQVRTALYGVDIVHIGIDTLAEAGIVLEGDVDGNNLI